jgi:hypothetical protein
MVERLEKLIDIRHKQVLFLASQPLIFKYPHKTRQKGDTGPVASSGTVGRFALDQGAAFEPICWAVGAEYLALLALSLLVISCY